MAHTTEDRTNEEVKKLYFAVKAFLGLLFPADRKLEYAVSLCEEDIEKKYVLCEKARINLAKDFAEKDENTPPRPKMRTRMRNGTAEIDPNTGDEVQEYVFTNEGQEKFNKALQDLMDTPVAVTRYTVPFEEVKGEYPPGTIPNVGIFWRFFMRPPVEQEPTEPTIKKLENAEATKTE